jgi:hypothetical protein
MSATAGGAEFIKVRNISQECHQGSGDRMWEEREISGPERMAIVIAICKLHTEHCNPIFLRGKSGFHYNGKLK